MQRAQHQFPTTCRGAGGIVILILGLSGAIPCPVVAQVYKSIDADGNVVYSSSPPANADPGQVQSIRIDPPPSAADVAAAERRLGRPSAPDAGAAREQPADAEATAPSQQQSKPSSQQIDETIQPARQTGREQRSSGGFGGEDRGRASGSISSGRSTR